MFVRSLCLLLLGVSLAISQSNFPGMHYKVDPNWPTLPFSMASNGTSRSYLTYETSGRICSSISRPNPCAGWFELG